MVSRYAFQYMTMKATVVLVTVTVSLTLFKYYINA